MKLIVVLVFVCTPKIAQYCVNSFLTVFQKHIIRLQIVVGNIVRVEILHSLEDLVQSLLDLFPLGIFLGRKRREEIGLNAVRQKRAMTLVIDCDVVTKKLHLHHMLVV